MSEWKEIFIDSACSRLSSGKSISSSLIKDKGDYPVYGGNGIRGFTNTYNFDGECAIIGRQGASCGNVRYFSGKAYMTEHAVVAVPTKEHNAYYLSCVLASLKLGRLSGQSAQPGIGVGLIGKQNIIMPSLATQQKIASILSSLDSKIENNRKICANLEAQAQALFKHWFVDFAPFKDGKFVESELGMIPEGWRVGRLGEIADINPSRTIQKGEKATYLDMKNMPTIGSFPLSWEVKEYNGGMKFMNGDTLMARITPCLENGKIAYVNFLQNKEIAFGSTEYIVLSPKNNLFSEYLYFLCRYSSFINYAVKNMNGSSGRQRVSGDTISNYDMIIAPKEIYKEVEPIFKDIMSHIKSLGQESILLSSLRDTLLPKLMSGEIKV